MPASQLEIVHTADAPAAIGPYSQAVKANGFLFTAGQIALDPATMQVVEGDVVAQADRALRNLTAVLTASGVSWSDVVKTTIFLADMADFGAVNEVYARALGDARPARSTVAVAGLPRGVRVEIELVAALPTQR
ncbi:endoribonuclease L-PSP [Gemmatirosa kalamazoonensis]|uniref:Endoribonuclease L-PSP n=1 Tax=Gemmatirosa kalamazoonensis TaxID=861299 RepID=W0RJY2_9BACT|nr:RidA family protein [Gemmatirosa kalamazoonensis]AHG90732.1 endoribonuclease L-PSP [Gemmatirosa kalamazoonensis]